MNTALKIYLTLLVGALLCVIAGAWATHALGATIITTSTSDTIDTFRTNVNTSLTNLNSGLQTAGAFSTSTALANTQVVFSTAVNTIGNSASFTYSSAATRLTVPYASTTALSVSNAGAVGSASLAIGSGNEGLYQAASGSLGLTNGTNGITWDGTALAPVTDSVRDLGINSTNRWNKLYVNNASTTAVSATTICITGDICRTTWPGGGSAVTSTFSTGATPRVVQLSVVSGDVVSWWVTDTAPNTCSGTTVIAADAILKQSTFAASTTVSTAYGGGGSSGASPCSATTFASQTATTTETWNLSAASVSSSASPNSYTLLVQKTH